MEGVILSLMSAICWALNGTFYKKAVSKVSVFTANFHRTIISSLCFAIIALPEISEIFEIDIKTALVLVLSAVLSFYLGDLLYLSSLKRCPVSIALPLSATYPIYVVILSPIIYRTHFSFIALVSAFLVFLAVVVVYGRKGDINTVGIIFALLAALSWSLAILSLDYLTSKLSVPVIAFSRMLLVLVLLAPLVKSNEIKEKESIIYAGIFAGFLTFVGVYFFISAVNISGSWRVAQPAATSPVFAALFGKIAFGEKIDLRLIVAISLIVISTLLLL